MFILAIYLQLLMAFSLNKEYMWVATRLITLMLPLARNYASFLRLWQNFAIEWRKINKMNSRVNKMNSQRHDDNFDLVFMDTKKAICAIYPILNNWNYILSMVMSRLKLGE